MITSASATCLVFRGRCCARSSCEQILLQDWWETLENRFRRSSNGTVALFQHYFISFPIRSCHARAWHKENMLRTPSPGRSTIGNSFRVSITPAWLCTMPIKKHGFFKHNVGRSRLNLRCVFWHAFNKQSFKLVTIAWGYKNWWRLPHTPKKLGWGHRAANAVPGAFPPLVLLCRCPGRVDYIGESYMHHASPIAAVDTCTIIYLFLITWYYMWWFFLRMEIYRISIHVLWPIPDSFGGFGVSTVAVFAGLALHHANSAAGFKARSPRGQILHWTCWIGMVWATEERPVAAKVYKTHIIYLTSNFKDHQFVTQPRVPQYFSL